MKDVYLSLRQDIVSGALQVGSQLTETMLADQYGVSRTPIREALRRLEQDGLVERSPRGGMRVRVWTVDEVFDLYEVRVVLEAQAAGVAAERRTRLDVIRLRQANEAMRTLEDKSSEPLRRANLAFHEAIWSASHNLPLIDVLSRLQRQIMRHPANTLMHPGRWSVVLDEHDRLVDAIEAGDAEGASSIASQHMVAARDIRLHFYQDEVATDGAGSASRPTPPA